jgi:opacity protein-like surface antigen
MRVPRVLIYAVVASLASATSAIAQDVHSSWAGFYLGIEGGANFLTDKTYGFAGLRAGYDLEFERFIVGAEVTADYRPGSTNNNFTWVGVPSGTLYQTSTTTMADFIGMTTFHIGYEIVNRLLPYVSGGVAFSPIEMKTAFSGLIGPNAGAFGANSSTTWRTGWVVGSGVRIALSDHWSLEPQYRYYRFPKVTLFTPGYLGGAQVASYTLSDTGRGSLVSLAANYRFW